MGWPVGWNLWPTSSLHWTKRRRKFISLWLDEQVPGRAELEPSALFEFTISDCLWSYVDFKQVRAICRRIPSRFRWERHAIWWCCEHRDKRKILLLSGQKITKFKILSRSFICQFGHLSLGESAIVSKDAINPRLSKRRNHHFLASFIFYGFRMVCWNTPHVTGSRSSNRSAYCRPRLRRHEREPGGCVRLPPWATHAQCGQPRFTGGWKKHNSRWPGRHQDGSLVRVVQFFTRPC